MTEQLEQAIGWYVHDGAQFVAQNDEAARQGLQAVLSEESEGLLVHEGRSFQVSRAPVAGQAVLACTELTAALACRRQRDLLEKVFESSYDGLTVTGADGRNLYINSAYANIIRCDPKEINGQHVKDLIAQGIIKTSPSLSVLRTKQPLNVMNYENGRTTFVSSTPLLDDAGEVEAVVSNVRDVSTIVELYEVLHNTAQSEAEQKGVPVIFRSREMLRVVQLAAELAAVDSTVLLQGETGTGKDVIARTIHSRSPRSGGPFVKVNCAAIPEALFESELFGYAAGAFTGANRQGKQGLLQAANGGTLFLDEIGEMPLTVQAKLLTALQEQCFTPVGSVQPIRVDLRVLAATNRNLEEMIAEKKFRADLYYRLNVVSVTIPPLRARPDDILPLSTYFLNQFNAKYSRKKYMIHEVYSTLERYPWPGNVRELQNLIEYLVVVGKHSIITPNSLPARFQNTYLSIKGFHSIEEVHSLDELEDVFYRAVVQEVYQHFPSSYKLAQRLQISQSKASRLIRKYLPGRT